MSTWRRYDRDPSVMFSVHAEDGTYLYAGEGAKLLGWEPKDLIGRNPYVDFLPEEDIADIARGHEALLGEGEEIVFVYRFPDGQGGFQWVESITYAAEGLEGKVTVSQTKLIPAQTEVAVRLARSQRNGGPKEAFEAHEA